VALAMADKERAEHWRRRAAECRAVAENLSSPSARLTMLETAAAYEVMAKRAEDRATLAERQKAKLG